MRIFKDLSLQEIRDCLNELGVPLTDEQFNSLTYDELTKMGRKARKAYNLYKQVDDIVKAKGKEKATPPTVQGQCRIAYRIRGCFHALSFDFLQIFW